MLMMMVPVMNLSRRVAQIQQRATLTKRLRTMTALVPHLTSVAFAAAAALPMARVTVLETSWMNVENAEVLVF